MIKLAVVFGQPPYGSASSREGLDALLAATAFCPEDELAVFFINEGVLNLVREQKPELILQKDFSPAFKLLDLCQIEQRYICQQSLQQWELADEQLLIKCQPLERAQLIEKLRQAEKLLSF